MIRSGTGVKANFDRLRQPKAPIPRNIRRRIRAPAGCCG
ncbi:hypothetical protein A8926_3340 [Saccharopolyspora spinosa]|uniref:Uncharacterized protein n=1 Tax=Saccharopolyspora spinosa TaxID=60894 RepID=A0A2N3XY42_SACSN|nr:hypothetical protein A8926_3340 [Saccharopolyspora spinosa]